MSADGSGTAASRFLAAAAAGRIVLCFAAESRKSHCNGGVKVANGALAAVFFHVGTDEIPFKIPLKNASKELASRSGFGAATSCNLCSRCASF